MPRSRSAFAAPIVLAALSGCQKPTHGTLTGKVTLDGQPISTGAIYFSPIDRKSASASCMIKDGAYTASVPINAHKVKIHSAQQVKSGKAGDATTAEGGVVKEVIPSKYNDKSDLQVTVGPGESTHDFDLKTK